MVRARKRELDLWLLNTHSLFGSVVAMGPGGDEEDGSKGTQGASLSTLTRFHLQGQLNGLDP